MPAGDTSRGSSAAQRAAASEACKGITLESLQAQYYRPLSDVAKDLRVSVARLLKKCREFGILRWPYRHVRSVQESIEQLEKDREAATDEMATDEMELRLRLLRRRGELVVHFASCGLEADMRKGIFLADPRDVDAMLAGAHAAHGGRKIPPPGWDSLGRFPEVTVREHFLEQMRAHMIGGGALLSPPDSPPTAAHVHDDSTSSMDESRDMSHHQHHQQAYRSSPQIAHTQAQWQQQQLQSHQQAAWQGTHPFPRYGLPDETHHLPPYWSTGRGRAGVSEGVGGGGGLSGGGRGVASADFVHMRSPGRGDYPAAVPISHGYAPVSVASSPMGQGPAVSATGTHHDDVGGSQARNTSSSPVLRPIYASGTPSVGSSYHALRATGTDVRGAVEADQRSEGQMPINSWGGASAMPGGGGGEIVEDRGGGGAGGGAGAGSGGHRDMWRPPERLTQPSTHAGAQARRAWGGSELANPSGRSGAPTGGALPSIFERHGGLDRPPLNFLAAPGVTGAGGTVDGGGQTVGVDPAGPDPGGPAREASSWSGGFHDSPIGGYGHRWGGTTQQQQALGRSVPSPRWQNGLTAGRPASAGDAGANETETGGGGSRGEPPWSAGSRAGMPGEGFDRQYVAAVQGGHHGAVGVEEGTGQSSQPPTSRETAWTQQDGAQQQRGERGEPPRNSSEQASHGPYF